MSDEFEGMTRKQANDSIKPTSGVMPTGAYDKEQAQKNMSKAWHDAEMKRDLDREQLYED